MSPAANVKRVIAYIAWFMALCHVPALSLSCNCQGINCNFDLRKQLNLVGRADF